MTTFCSIRVFCNSQTFITVTFFKPAGFVFCYFLFSHNNRPFLSSLVPLFQSKPKWETILMKMTDLHGNETACRTHFHMKGFRAPETAYYHFLKCDWCINCCILL